MAFDIETTNITDNGEYQYTDDSVFNYIRKIKIRYNDIIKTDIADFEQIRRLYTGNIHLYKNKGTPVDVLYVDLSDKYPSGLAKTISVKVASLTGLKC